MVFFFFFLQLILTICLNMAYNQDGNGNLALEPKRLRWGFLTNNYIRKKQNYNQSEKIVIFGQLISCCNCIHNFCCGEKIKFC
jgi:hypothetical protein